MASALKEGVADELGEPPNPTQEASFVEWIV